MTLEEAGHYCPPSWRCSCGAHTWAECNVLVSGDGRIEAICPEATTIKEGVTMSISAQPSWPFHLT